MNFGFCVINMHHHYLRENTLKITIMDWVNVDPDWSCWWFILWLPRAPPRPRAHNTTIVCSKLWHDGALRWDQSISGAVESSAGNNSWDYLHISVFILFVSSTQWDRLKCRNCMANVNVEDIKFHQVQKVITCSSDGTWILIICNRSIWLIDAKEGIF